MVLHETRIHRLDDKHLGRDAACERAGIVSLLSELSRTSIFGWNQALAFYSCLSAVPRLSRGKPPASCFIGSLVRTNMAPVSKSTKEIQVFRGVG